jgi:hypothetical protein
VYVQMGLFKHKSKTGKKDDGRSEKGDRKKVNPERGDLKKVKYVWLSSHKAIFIIIGEVKESKFSYGIPIIPLQGYYRSKGKSYTPKMLSDYYVILNLPKDADISELKGKRVVILGYDKDALYITNDNDEDEGEKK